MTMTDAADKLNEVRKQAADELDIAATSFRKTGRQGADTLRSASESAASALHSTAGQVRDFDLGEIAKRVRRDICQYQVGALLIAVGIGFALGNLIHGATTPKA